MLIRVISKRVSCSISDMISQLHNLFVSPAVYEKPFTIQSPVLIKVRFFRHFVPTYGPKLSIAESNESPISLTACQFSRGARSEAQVALFDYLHGTRGFQFTDAEHISKNSPQFLQNLLSKVDNEQDVSRALSRFFRYNPINEFEPFLESLGLPPSEFASFLPRNLIFLGDDHVMLENFHVLCDFGIPRSKIGKLFKEANEIFRYEYGILAMKLRAYEELGLSKSTVIKLVICCPSLFVGGVNIEFAAVHERLKGLGFGKDWALGYLSDKRTYNWSRMIDTMNFLAEIGYNEMQMGLLFKTNPALLFEVSGKMIYVLICRLLKLGLNMSEVYALILQNPQILSAKSAKNLCKAVYFLFGIGMDTKAIAKIVTTQMHSLGSHPLKGPQTVLKSLKVDRGTLCKIIEEDPSKLISLASKVNTSIKQAELQNPSKFLEKTTFLLRLGYTENSEEMTKALKQFRGRGDQLQERFDCLVEAGLDYNVVSSMIKQAPSVLNQSKEVLEKKIDCLRSCLGYPPESIAGFPSYLCYDIGRINLRFSMYVWLRQRGAVKSMLSVSTLIASSDARFVKYFVDCHPEGPLVWESIKKSIPSS